MQDYSNDPNCCLNCRDCICNKGRYCNYCLCKNCIWYEFDRFELNGYCSLVHNSVQDSENYEEDEMWW